MLTTPAGSPASSISSPSRSADSGVCSAGLSTTVHAGRERRAELPGRHQQREVPRDDLPDHADRLLARVGEELRPGRGDAGDRDRVALDLRRPARHVVEQVGGQRRRRPPWRPSAACRCRASRASPARRRCCSIRSPMRWMTLPRSDGVIRRQSERSSSKHRRAAPTASSMSSAAPCATRPRLSSVAGSSVSKVFPLAASTHSPSISRRPGLRTKSWVLRPEARRLRRAGRAVRCGDGHARLLTFAFGADRLEVDTPRRPSVGAGNHRPPGSGAKHHRH